MSTSEEKKQLSRPFSKDILIKAKAIVEQYKIVLWQEEGVWYGCSLEYPTAYGDGKDPNSCVTSTLNGLTACVAYMLENNQTPPAPKEI